MYQKLLSITIFLLIFATSNLYAQENYIDSLRTAINPAVTSVETVDAINELGEQLIQSGEWAEAKEWLLLGFEVSEKLDDKKNKPQFDILLSLGSLYLSKEIPDSSILMFEQADQLEVSPEDRNRQYNLHATALRMDGQLFLASQMYENAIEQADSLGREDQVAGLKMNLGAVYSSMGERTGALHNYYDALVFAEQEKDSVFIAVTSNNIGNLFIEMEEFEQSAYYLDQAENISRQIQDQVNLRRVLLNQGNLYSNLGMYDQAEAYYEEAVSLTDQMGDYLASVRIYYNLGLMEMRRGDVGRAEEIFTYTLDESRNLSSLEGQFNSAISLGELQMKRESYGSAARWFARAQSLVEDSGYQSLQLDAYEKLYLVYKRAGNSSMALQWLERMNDLEDRMASEEKLRLQAEYETLFNIRTREQQAEIIEARQQETQAKINLQRWLIGFAFSVGGFLLAVAVVLSRSNKKVKEVNSELEDSNRQIREVNNTVQTQNEELERVNQIKNKLFAIIAHDLRGPLSSLQSLIYLIREHDLSKDELNNILDTLDRNIQENSNMMDNLLAWAKAQMNGIHLTKRTFDLSEAINAVVDQILFQANNKGIKIDKKYGKNLPVKADYDIVKLILRNLVANAIKFSETGDKIMLEAFPKDEVIEIHIKDEGVGIKEENQAKLFSKEQFSTNGTKNEKGSGLGLNLSKEFVEEHGGNLWFESKYGEGTTFIFTLPKAGQKMKDESSQEEVNGNQSRKVKEKVEN